MSFPEYNTVKTEDLNAIHEEYRILQACVSAASENEDLDTDVRCGIHLQLNRFTKVLDEIMEKTSNLIRYGNKT